MKYDDDSVELQEISAQSMQDEKAAVSISTEQSNENEDSPIEKNERALNDLLDAIENAASAGGVLHGGVYQHKSCQFISVFSSWSAFFAQRISPFYKSHLSIQTGYEILHLLCSKVVRLRYLSVCFSRMFTTQNFC